MANSLEFDGLNLQEARDKIAAKLKNVGFAESRVEYKMRDWLISRQRYWGAPIPIIHCHDCGPVAVPEVELPVALPEVEDYRPSGDGRSPLAKVADWVSADCPKCGKPSQRETDTMDGYVCSSWYQMRYIDPLNSDQAWSPERAKKWLPVNFYNGGDHATAHLLYARFFTRFFYKKGLVGNPEPFERMYFHAKILASDGTFFSKSKGNGIDPLEVIGQGYGADALRTYIMFIAPPDVESPWNNDGLPSCYRFLNRIWNLVFEFKDVQGGNGDSNDLILQVTHRTIKKVSEDIEAIKFNTAVSAMMECVNELYRLKDSNQFTSSSWRVALESLVMLIAPFAPHIAEELWHELGHADSVHVNHWPQLEERYLVADKMTIAVQVNGKLRSEVTLVVDTAEEDIKTAALAEPNVIKYTAGKQIVKVIYVAGRIVSIVVA